MFEPVETGEAVRILVSETGHEADDLVDVATLLGCEPPVLRWAASLARTIGWGPLRPRLVSWSLPDVRLPWNDDVARVIATLPPADAELLATLAACDAPFAWDVLESVVSAPSIESICRLEDASVLRRNTRAGVVTFVVPYAVRAYHRVTGSIAVNAERWLEAWVKRSTELRRTSYGHGSRAALSELTAAVGLAARALFASSPASRARGLALWNAASDALFFGEAIAFDAPAFARAVEVADAVGSPEARVRARIVAGRALLERGDPGGASTLVAAALTLAVADDDRADVLRGAGWAALALTKFDEAGTSFEEARTLSPQDPRRQADAIAGLGVLALLGGDASHARALLEEAVAIHVVMRDAPREAAVRGMMELLPEARDASADVASLSAQVDDFRASGQRWREALALGRLALAARARGDVEGERARLVEARAAATLSRMPASNVVRALIDANAEVRPFIVGPDGRTLTLPSGEMHDLARYGPVRRILLALAVARRERPGIATTTLAMIEAGWPGEKMQHGAATLRVYTTIRRLRALGLADALVTRDEGYLIDPEVALVLE